MNNGWRRLSDDLVSGLKLNAPPIAITFRDQAPPDVEHYDAPFATPAEDGRTGRVPAGCVFWMKAVDRTFTTVAEDHRNCSVGTLTHGFASLEDVAGNADVAAMLAADWVTADVMPEIPTVRDNPGTVTYGPLRDTSVDPDVVLLRISPAQLMVLSDAVPDLHIGGKPQCHIIALAKEHDTIAASTGCALSRERTRMSPNEMTAALPGARVAEVVERLRATTAADKSVAFYAAHDSRRFPS